MGQKPRETLPDFIREHGPLVGPPERLADLDATEAPGLEDEGRLWRSLVAPLGGHEPRQACLQDPSPEESGTFTHPGPDLSPDRSPPVPGASPVAIVGGGIAGLACARTLHEAGLAVTVLDKGRGAGGRTSTRRHATLRFDHGAQYFTTRDPSFRTFVRSWEEAGVVARWDGRVRTVQRGAWGEPRGTAERFVGIPGMSAVARHLGKDLEVRYGTRVLALEKASGQGWKARTQDGLLPETFGAVVVAVPAPQAFPLLAETPQLRERVAAVRLSPCIAVMAAFAEALPVPADGAFVSSSKLGWIARDSSKPGRPQEDCWVLHATSAWSEAHLEASPADLIPDLLDAAALRKCLTRGR